MKEFTSKAETIAGIREAIRTGRRQEARVLAAAMRIEWPEEAAGWLWSAWLAETATEARLFAGRALSIAPGGAAERLLHRATRQGEHFSPLSNAEIWELAGLQPLPSSRASRQRASAPPPVARPPRPAPPPSSPDEVDGEPEALPARARPSIRLALTLLVPMLLLFGLSAWFLLERYSTSKAAPVAGAPHAAIELKEEAERLWAAGERLAALTRYEEAHGLAPQNEALITGLAQLHVALATDLLKARDPDGALPHLESAYQLLPEERAILHEYQALMAYLAGREAIGAGKWERGVQALLPLYRLDPAYLDVRELAERAVAGQRQLEIERRARLDRVLSHARLAAPGRAARHALEPPALSNEPGQSAMPPLGPFAPRSNKHIVVSINAQRMYVYENDRLIWNWVASTGEPERPTIPGRYRIQSKFVNARSDAWSLWMPYWQGIYWAGAVENGIHGQVTFDEGGRLWEGYLGTQITFGCVMISDRNAATLFEWTEMGTPVSIHWNWDPAWIPDGNGDRKN